MKLMHDWLLSVLLLGLILGGCRPVTQPSPAGAAPAAAVDPTHLALIKQFIEVWNDTDTSELDAVVSPEFVMHNADIPHMDTASAIKARVIDAHSMVHDFRNNLIDVFGDGEWYMVRSQLEGTWSSEPFVYGVLNLLHIVDNRIAEAWQVSDELAVDMMVGGFPNPDRRRQFAWGDDSAVTGNPGESAANKALVEQWWQAGEEARVGLTSDQFVFHSTEFPEQHTYAERQAALAALRTTFPDLQMTIDGPLLAVGDKVGLRLTATGTNRGPFLGLDPTNEVLTWPGLAVYRIADGKIVEEWILWSLDKLYYEIKR